ncbi:MAG: metallophosphoesterase [Candidatus Nanopelagicales bacterium]
MPESPTLPSWDIRPATGGDRGDLGPDLGGPDLVATGTAAPAHEDAPPATRVRPADSHASAGPVEVSGAGAAWALLIGDVAGHLDALRWALEAHGVDLVSATVPDGLVVVQVGDLVHRGPDSAGVIALVDRFLRGPYGDRWVQLIGNHEQPYVFDRPTTIRRELDDRSTSLLRAWWDEGLAHVGAALRPDWDVLELPRRMRGMRPSGDILVTHAGLTHGAWLALGRPATPAAAAAAINADALGPATVTLRTGTMTTGRTDLAAGPLWAQGGAELLMSWEATDDASHLNQIHGHTTVRRWDRERWRPGAGVIVNRGDLVAVRTARWELARVGERLIWGIDPGHDQAPASQWQPLLIPLAGGTQSPRRKTAGWRWPRPWRRRATWLPRT